MATIVLIRHGESQANARGVVEGGDGDSPLSELGIQQAAKAASHVITTHPHIDAIYSSPLRRALQTAQTFARHLHKPVVSAPDLIEGRIGNWNYQPFSALNWSLLDADPDYKQHGGESPRELALRSSRFLRRIPKQHYGKTVLVVAHGATITHGLASILGTTPVTGSQYQIGHTGIMMVDWTTAQPKLLVENDLTHLAG